MTTAAPRRHDRTATCKAILDATADIILEKGLDGFTISEISRRADVNRALIYHYYQNRENLITHAIDLLIDRYDTPETSLSGDAVARSARAYIEHPEIGRFIFQILLSGRPLLRLGERFSSVLEHFEELKRQQFPDSDEDATFSMIMIALSQFSWTVARDELAKTLGMSLEEADERFIEEQRRVSDLALREFFGGQPSTDG